MRKNQRSRDRASNKPIEPIVADQKTAIENVTFQPKDARFLQTNKNVYKQTMYGEIKGLENSDAQMAYTTWKAFRGALMKSGEAYMKWRGNQNDEFADAKITELSLINEQAEQTGAYENMVEENQYRLDLINSDDNHAKANAIYAWETAEDGKKKDPDSLIPWLMENGYAF
tara:strand:+ start:566 stop:1078 length:513 start_codon:yes stop_codon:yes gene_type:complete